MTKRADEPEFDTWLLSERAVVRVHAFAGDLVARLLVTEKDDDALAGLRDAGPVYQGRDGTVAVLDGELAATTLRDERFALVPGPDPGQYTLSCVDEVLHAATKAAVPTLPAVSADLAATMSGALRAHRAPAEFDLIAEVIRPAIVALLSDALGIYPGRRESFGKLTAHTGIAFDAAITPPRLLAARDLISALGELRDLCGQQTFAVAVVASELAVNLTTNTVLTMFDGGSRADTGALVRQVLRRDPPLRLHRLFTSDPVELGGTRIESNTRVLVVDPATSSEQPAAFAAHPGLAELVTAVAVAVTGALGTHLPSLRLAGPPLRRLRAPATRAVVQAPVTLSDREER